MAACCAIAALIIWKFMSIHRELLPAKTQSKDPGITVSYSEPEAEDARPVTRACRLSLKGLTCHGCVSTVRSSLESSPGVIDVSVSFQSLSACIQYNHKKATTDEFIKRIQETGYEAALLVESEDWKSSWLNAAASRESTIEDQTTSLTFSVATTGVVSALETLFPWLMPNTTLAVIWLALTFVITSLAVALLARPIHREAFYALRHWKLSSSLLSSLGLITVLCSVMYERVSLQTFAPERGVGGHTLTSTCMLIAVLNGSRMIKAVLAQRSARFATNLAQATPHTAKVVTNLSLKDPESSSIPAELLRPGDYVLIHPDSPFPADGTVVCGKSTAMRTILNGELAAEPVEQGSSIYAGCMNGGGQVIARVLRTGKQTLLSQALRALSQANNGRKATDHGTDKYLAWFSSFTLCFTALVGIFHTMIGVTFRIVLSKMATVLLCACPCAMGVGIPICFMIATANAHDLGIVLKPGPYLARACTTRAVVFDKTGTLTMGELVVKNVLSVGEWEENSEQRAMLWQAVYELCRESQHPVSRLLSKVALEHVGSHPCGSKSATLSSYEEQPGLGLSGNVSSEQTTAMEVAIGNTRLMHANNVYFAPAFSKMVEPLSACSFVYISINGQLAARVTYYDPITPDAEALIEALHARGLETFIMTGDTSDAALSVARQVGIKAVNVHSSLSPSGKAERIVRLERQLGPVIMIGDNVNDGPALFAATLGVVLHSGDAEKNYRESPLLASLRTDVDAFLLPTLSTNTFEDVDMPANETMAKLTNFLRIIYLIDLVRETDQCLKQVMHWSISYNILALTLAGGILVPFLPTEFAAWASLTPAYASLSMAISSAVSLLFCFRFQGWRPAWYLQLQLRRQ